MLKALGVGLLMLAMCPFALPTAEGCHEERDRLRDRRHALDEDLRHYSHRCEGVPPRVYADRGCREWRHRIDNEKMQLDRHQHEFEMRCR